jgi:hypothetical protein
MEELLVLRSETDEYLRRYFLADEVSRRSEYVGRKGKED